MQRTPRSVLTAVLALAAGLALSHACTQGANLPGNGSGSDAGDAGDAGAAGDAGNGTGSSDAGDGGGTTGSSDGGDAGAVACTSDLSCGANRWCEQSSGTCRDAKPCPQGQGNCDYQFADPDYCAGQRCFCDPVDQGCKPLHRPCTACVRSVECGNDALAYDYASDCVPADAGLSAVDSCIPRRATGCPPGYQTPATGTYCVPAGGHCGAQGACTSDNDCDPHSATPICNTALQLCVAACIFDLKTGESPSCPTGQVCSLTPTLATLPPQDPNYGKGRCGPPCTNATACGSGLVCRSEGIDHPVQRCGLPPPECLGNVECADSPATHSTGYCDLAAHACKTDCRSNGDCHAGYLCASNTCVAETCLQAGGATAGCDYGQFCCGETDGPAPCPSAVDGGACYDKPGATWCGTCTKDDDCNKAPYPSRPGNKNYCWDTGNGKYCALGCDVGHTAECPRSWQCSNIFVGCKANDDCGSQTGAHCDLPSDGGAGLCTCADTTNCPNDANNTTTCRSGKCVFTSVCRPGCP